MSFPVVLDACVLVPLPVCDLLLRIAAKKEFRALWSEDILSEVKNTLTSKFRLDASSVNYRVSEMCKHYPDALVLEYKDLIPAMKNDPKDRHVLAAAVRANAELIVTFNLRDFPKEALEPYDVRAIHPDDFLCDQFELNPVSVIQTTEEIIAALANPEITKDEYLDRLSRGGLPKFCEMLRRSSFHKKQ